MTKVEVPAIEKARVIAQLQEGTPEYQKHTVTVREFKFDSIRQESYWVTKEVRTYRLRSDAETFAARFKTQKI